jgi:hypothetical protein
MARKIAQMPRGGKHQAEKREAESGKAGNETKGEGRRAKWGKDEV